MHVHDWQRAFLTTMPIKRGLFPLADTMWAKQTQPPYRKGVGIVVRVSLGTGLGIGLWGPARDVEEHEALLDALVTPASWGRGGGTETDAALLPIREGQYQRWHHRIAPPVVPRVDPRAVLVLVVLWALGLTALPA